jgi:hypothetical protein
VRSETFGCRLGDEEDLRPCCVGPGPSSLGAVPGPDDAHGQTFDMLDTLAPASRSANPPGNPGSDLMLAALVRGGGLQA